jgi:exosortase/archaeosortase family protein
MAVDWKGLKPTEDNRHPLLKLKGKERTNFTLVSFSITMLFIILLYVLPTLYELQIITTKVSFFFLTLFGFDPRYFMYEDQVQRLNIFEQFMYQNYDTNRATYPAIAIEKEGTVPNHYLVVKACTGMQAGALLLGLIWSTPASLNDRIRASYMMLLALFIGNALRIASMIAITTILTKDFGLGYNLSWTYSHDRMGQPLGFFGTIAFVILIEKKNVRILDTISVWMDTVWEFIFPPKKKSLSN